MFMWGDGWDIVLFWCFILAMEGSRIPNRTTNQWFIKIKTNWAYLFINIFRYNLLNHDVVFPIVLKLFYFFPSILLSTIIFKKEILKILCLSQQGEFFIFYFKVGYAVVWFVWQGDTFTIQFLTYYRSSNLKDSLWDFDSSLDVLSNSVVVDVMNSSFLSDKILLFWLLLC